MHAIRTPSTRTTSTPTRSALSLGTIAAACLLLAGGCENSPKQAGGGATETPRRAPLPSVALAPDAPASEPIRIESNDRSYFVIYRTRPPVIPVNESFAIEVQLFDARSGQRPISDAQLDVDAAMPEHRHGMNVVPQVWKNNDGSYTTTGMVFHMPGRWEIYFDITRNGVTERAQAEVFVE